MAALPETIVIGRTTGVFGIKGECKVQVFSDSPERFLPIRHVWIEQPTGALEPRTIERVRIHKGVALVTFTGIDSPEQAEPLLRRNLHIPKSERQPLGPDEFYVSDLLGLRVLLPDDTVLGTLREVIETGANDVYEVQGTGRNYYIPATKEVIGDVDLTARTMRITPLPGLLD